MKSQCETDRTDQNGPERTYENTETDFEEYQNGFK